MTHGVAPASPDAPDLALVPDFVRRVPLGAYRSLNPVTKLVIAFVEAIVAIGVREWTGPLVVLAAVAVSAATAGILRRLLPFALATIPIVASIMLVNTFLYPNAHDTIVRLGPLDPTWSGLRAAVQATLRVVAFALSAAVFALTTAVDDLLGELERRGLGRRGSFVVGSALGAIPRMVERAGEVVDSQRARGLDTEGGLIRRARGVVPLAGPMVFGALAEVEERTMALEARAFSAPARRTVIRALPDSTAQRVARWILFLGCLVLVVASLTALVRLP